MFIDNERVHTTKKLDSKEKHPTHNSDIVTIVNKKPQKVKSKHKSHSKHKRHKKFKPLISTNIDGYDIMGVDNQTDYNIIPLTQSEANTNSEANLLNELFAHNSLHVALKHDMVEDCDQKDHFFVQSAAMKTAESALKALVRSREQLRDQPLGVPTWTGQNGGVPLLVSGSINMTHFSNKPISNGSSINKSIFSGKDAINESNGPLPSTALLESIRMRTHPRCGDDDTTPSTALDKTTESLIRDIHCFISFQANLSGRATTDELLNKFSSLSSEQAPLFKAILKQMCHFSRYAGDGLWKLKAAYS